MQKQGVWVLWIGSVAAMILGGGWVATAGKWVFGITLVAHIIEFFVQRPLFERAGGSLSHHFVQTLIYGLYHWMPIKKRLESEGAGASSDA
jgi:hypothetical protein